MVQAALMNTVYAQQLLDGGCLRDLGSEHCWGLGMTIVIALAMFTMVAAVTVTVA